MQAIPKSLHGGTSTERRTEVSKKISDILPKTEILAQLAEKASKLAQSALELRRAVRVRERKVRLVDVKRKLLCRPQYVKSVKLKAEKRCARNAP